MLNHTHLRIRTLATPEIPKLPVENDDRLF